MRTLGRSRPVIFGLVGLIGLAMLTACVSAGDSGSQTTAMLGDDAEGSVGSTLSYLFVIDAESGESDGTTLTLSGVDQKVVRFADRPNRLLDHLTPGEFVELWHAGLFAGDPPNAAVSWFESGAVHSSAVEITHVAIEDESLLLEYDELQDVDPISQRSRPLSGPIRQVSVVVDSAQGYIVMPIEFCLVSSLPGSVTSSCNPPTDDLLAEFNVSGPYPEEEVNGVWRETSFTSGGVIVHDTAAQARVNVTFYCNGLGDPSALYTELVDWVGSTWDPGTYGSIPEREPDCGNRASDGWCQSDGSGFNALASNTIRCNWMWSGAPTPPAFNTLSSGEIMDLVPAPWEGCPLDVHTLGEAVSSDGDPDLPDEVCTRYADIAKQAAFDATHNSSLDSGSYSPSNLDEVWDCDFFGLIQCSVPDTSLYVVFTPGN